MLLGVFCPSGKFLITRLLPCWPTSKWLEDVKDDSIKLQLRPAQEPGWSWHTLALIWGQTPGPSAHLGWGWVQSPWGSLGWGQFWVATATLSRATNLRLMRKARESVTGLGLRRGETVPPSPGLGPQWGRLSLQLRLRRACGFWPYLPDGSRRGMIY